MWAEKRSMSTYMANGRYVSEKTDMAWTAWRSAIAFSTAYVVDDSAYPRVAQFANGRMVKYRLEDGRAFLGIGMNEGAVTEQ